MFIKLKKNPLVSVKI